MKHTLNIHPLKRAMNTKLLASLAAALLLASCAQSNLTGSENAQDEIPAPPQEEELVPMRITLMADGTLTTTAAPSKTNTISETAAEPLTKALNETPQTKAAAGPDETLVKDAWILQFGMESSAAEADGTLIYRKYISGSDIYQSNTLVEISTMLAQGDHCVIVVVANPTETLDDTNIPDGTKLSEFRKRTLPVTSTTGTSLPDDASTALPMYGESANMPISLIGAPSIALKLTRLIARMSLTLINPYAKADTYPYLELQEVAIHNAPTLISYSPLTETNTYQQTLFPDADAANFRNYTATAKTFGETNTFKWYIAPNRRGTGTATKPEDKNAFTAPEGQANYCTFIQIKGLLKETAEAAQTEVYYNVYLGNDNIDDYNLWANHAYNAKLTITGFNDGMMEVGFDGFAVEIGGIDGTADNTIIGWHPDTGLEYVPGFSSFSPDQIDFGDQPTAADASVTFEVNSGWRFSYTSGNKDMVIASSTQAPDQDQVGGAEGEPVKCTVTFTPKAYTATEGTPAAGDVYNTVATFKVTGTTETPDTRTTIFLRTIPAFYGEPQVSPASGTQLTWAAQSVQVTLASNAPWSASANPGTTTTQQKDVYATRSRNVIFSANNSWTSRQVTVTVKYGENSKTFTYTQAGMSITGVTINPNPADGIPSEGKTYTVTISGDFSSVPVRAITGNTVLASANASPGKGVGLNIPYNPTTSVRQVTFQYQKNGQWINISSGSQAIIENVDIGGGTILDPNYPKTGWWDTGIDYCKGKGSGWRLPTLNELRYYYALSPGLDGTDLEFVKEAHWAATTYDNDNVYFLNYVTGDTRYAPKSHESWNSQYYIRCIKGISTINVWPRFQVNGSSVVVTFRDGANGFPEACVFPNRLTQTNTGIVTSNTDNKISRSIQIQPQDGPKSTFEGALSYCDNLTLDGYNNWRLPTARELHMLFVLGANTNVRRYDQDNTGIAGGTQQPVIPTYLYNIATWFTPFGNTPYWSGNYDWNGETELPRPEIAVIVDFYNGYSIGGTKGKDTYAVRCVRDAW